MPRPLVVMFDTDFGGHIPLHAREFARAALADDFGFDVLLCLPPAILQRLPTELTQQFSASGRLRFHSLSDADVKACNSPNSIIRGIRKWKLGQSLAHKFGAHHVFYFVLDIILAGSIVQTLSLKSSVPYSGILFRPRLHLPSRSGKSIDRLKTMRQYPYYAIALSLTRLSNIWTLDPFFAEYGQKYLPRGSAIKFIGEAKILPDISATPMNYGPKTRFLTFGLLKERKGTLVLLKALTALSDDDWAKIEIVMLGEFEPSIKSEALKMLQELEKNRNANIFVESRYVSDEEIAEALYSADVILANYLGHVGSSGVVFAAALANRPVITQDDGLLGQLARTFGLGITVNTSEPEELADALKLMSDPKQRSMAFDADRASEYIAINKQGFAAQILSEIQL